LIRKFYKRIKKKNKFKNSISKSETLFFDTLEQLYNIKIQRQYVLKFKKYDGRIGKILLECDSERFHHTKKERQNDSYKDLLAKKFGFILYRIKLNNTREVTRVISEHKELFEKLFGENKSVA